MEKKIRYLSLFSGIGSPEMALRDLNIDYELVGFSEIDKNAIKSYCAVHGVDESLNIGDITKVNIDTLPNDIDLLTHGSPCQAFSSCGKQLGGDEGSGTTSSLMWNTVEIIRAKKPKIVIWENVKNVLSKKHKHNFEKYLKELDLLGYKSVYKVINSKDLGTPMNRERIFVISLLNHKEFDFSNIKYDNVANIRDYLEDGLSDENIKVSEDIKPGCRAEFLKHYDNIINCNKDNYDCRAKSDFQDKKVGIKISYCIRANSTNTHILDNKTIRKLTPKEFWRFMNFNDTDFEIAKLSGVSNTNLCKLAGNSIDLKIMKELFRILFVK